MADKQNRLSPYLSPLSVWALAVGTSVGWGSMVVTCNTYLKQAGPVGSIAGLLIGAAVMLVIARNMGFLINQHPGAGGIYGVTRDYFGYDRAFLVSWFVSLTYMAMVWTTRVEGSVAKNTVGQLRDYYNQSAPAEVLEKNEDAFLEEMLDNVQKTNSQTTTVVLSLFAVAVGVMLINHFSTKKWEEKAVRERDKAREAAYRDSLTGVKSKIAFSETEAEFDKAIVEGETPRFSVIVCDVNGLKYVNDTLGHTAGDALIRNASEVICSFFKHSPVFRVGGDEFVILPEGQDLEQRQEILEKLNALMESNIAAGEVVASLGIADYDPAQDHRFHDVFVRADKAMYDRKLALKAMGSVTRD